MGGAPLRHASATTNNTNAGEIVRGELENSDRGKRDTPESTFLEEPGFELLIDWGLNIEEGKDACDVNEEGSHRKVFPGTDPVRGNRRENSGAVESIELQGN